MKTRVATAADWKTVPLPDRYAVLTPDFSLDAAESALMRQGMIPLEMEDKWFLYCEGDTLHVHRSWSGICFAQVDFVPCGEGLRAVSAKFNREPEQYVGIDDQSGIKLIEQMVRGLHAWQRHVEDFVSVMDYPSRAREQE